MGTGLSDQLTRSVLKAPGFWGGLAVRAFTRSWGRDVMLYTGGVSFFALLAVFPAIAILIGFYKLGLSINEVSAQAAALSDLLPRAAQTIFRDEIARLSNASARCWNCWGLISSAPIRFGMIRERPETSLNLFAKICVLMMYLSITSMWLLSLNAVYISPGSTSWEVRNNKPFSSKDISMTEMLFASANPAMK